MSEQGASLERSYRTRKVSKHGNNRYQEFSMNSDQNQFIPKQAYNPSYHTLDLQNPKIERSLVFSESSSPAGTKKGIIQQLTQKNELLRREVDRVQKILNLGDRKKPKMVPIINEEVLKQQLQNAYKQIKIYEDDVAKRKKYYQHEGNYVEMIRKAEHTLIERQDMVKRLQIQIIETKKQSNQYTKLLQDGHIKQEYASKTSKLHKEIKYLQNMLKQEDNLAATDENTTQKKQTLISKMEVQLMEGGFSRQELTTIKRKFEVLQYTAPSQMTQRKQVSDDRKPQKYDEMKSQMQTLKKMQRDYAKKISELQFEKVEAADRSKDSKYKLEQTEKEIERLTEEFINLKKSIDPAKLKPAIKNGINFNESSFTQFENKSNGNPMEHKFQVMEVGSYNKKLKVFNDRLLIGSKSAKIVELTLYENRTQFLGFQATYLIGETQKKGGLNLIKRENQRYLKNKNTKLVAGDYFKNFEFTINKDDIIVGFIAVSFEGKAIKAGPVDGFKKEIEMKDREYPCCIFGCYTEIGGFQLIGVEKVQPQ